MLSIAHTSDLHFDTWQHRALDVARAISLYVKRERADVLLLGGDIAANLDVYRECLGLLVESQAKVMVVPGNHCLWRTGEGEAASRERHDDILPSICREMGAIPLWVEPTVADNVLFAGSYGHYDYSFAVPELLDSSIVEFKGPYENTVWNDHHYLRWDSFMTKGKRGNAYLDDRALFEHLLGVFDTQVLSSVQEYPGLRGKVALLHTVPFKRGVWYKGNRDWDQFSAFIGGEGFGESLVRHSFDLCVYGHTHRHMEVEERGVRAINSAFGYPGENWFNSSTLEEYIPRSVRISVL